MDDFIGKVLSVPLCPYHFVRTILSNTILSVYHFVRTILSVPFCPLPFCPRTVLLYKRHKHQSLLKEPNHKIAPYLTKRKDTLYKSHDINSTFTAKIHSFRIFLQHFFKSTTTQRRSRHSTDTVSEFHAEAPQATASEGVAQGPYVAARARFEPTILKMKGDESTNEPPCPTNKYKYITPLASPAPKVLTP